MTGLKALLIPILPLALILGVCSSPTPTLTVSPGPVPTATPTPTAVVSNPPLGEPGGILMAIVTADIPSRDVHQEVSETLASKGPGIAYSRLLRLRMDDSINQPSLLLECDLCQNWEMLDPMTYRFRLRDGVRWQDLAPVNGRKLKAQDLVFSYNRQRTQDWPNALLLGAVDAFEAEDDLTLKVTLRFPDVDFLLAMADGHSKIVAPEAVAVTGDLREGPVVGTGPWIWRKTEVGEGSDFEANEGYFEEGLPFLKELSFRVIRDQETQIAAFITGSIDVYDLPPQARDEFEALSSGHSTFLSKQGGQGVILALNAGQPPFDDESLRRAVFKALDPWGTLEEVWRGQGFVSLGVPVVEATWLPAREEMAPFFTGAGVESGNAAFQLVVVDFGDIFLDHGLSIERDLREAGFDPELKVLNPVEYSERVWQQKDYQIFVGPAPPTSSPNSYLFSVLHSGGQWNILDHGDAILDGLIEAQQEAFFHGSERRELVLDIQRRLLEKAYSFSPVTQGIYWVFQPGVKGFYPNTALSEYFYWAKTWVEG